MRMRSPRVPIVVLSAIVALGCSVVLGPGSAAAYWSVASAVPGSGRASAATVMPGAIPIVTVATQNDITVDWDPTTLSNRMPVTGYTVTRYNASHVAQTVLSGCVGILTDTTCVESGVPDGVWTYAVTPRFAVNWVGTSSAESTAVKADNTAPINNISRVAVSGNSYLAGTTVYYRGAAAGSFQLLNAVVDSGSGPASSITSTLSGVTTGWEHTPSTVGTPTGGPFLSNAFSWAAGTTAQPTIRLAGTDTAGNLARTDRTFVPDDVGPSGGAVGYAGGYTTAANLAVTLGPISDTGAGVSPGGIRVLQLSSAPLTGSTCGTFTAFADHITDPAVTPSTQTVVVARGSCYQYRYAFSDNLGNQTVTTSPNIVKARNYEAMISNTGGILSHWRMADTGTTADDIRTANNNGTYAGAPTQGVAGAIVGDSNTAVSFDGVNDSVQVLRQLSADFSIELWFKSSQGLGSGNKWKDGAGLVGAEVAGTAKNDFGITLMANGRVAAGTGTPDVTAMSPAGFNNGVWHHVVLTRTASTGVVRLYVDGALQTTVTGGKQALTGSSTMSFGRINSGGNFYNGMLDEVAVYTSVLSAAQVSDHNASAR